MSSQLLVHFDPKLEICLACDVLAYAVLLHKMPDGLEKSVGFASRTLTETIILGWNYQSERKARQEIQRTYVCRNR